MEFNTFIVIVFVLTEEHRAEKRSNELNFHGQVCLGDYIFIAWPLNILVNII